MDWVVLITALAAFLTAAVALFQIHATRVSIASDLMLRLDERFKSEEFRVKRRAAARALLDEKDLENVDDVLDFFETIAILGRRKAVDPFLVWHMFFYRVHGYWLKGRDYIETVTREDPLRYAFLHQFHDKLLKIEQRERNRLGVRPASPPDNIWDRFLQEELSLEPAPRTGIPDVKSLGDLSTLLKLIWRLIGLLR